MNNPYEMLFNYWWSTNIVMMCTIHDSMKPFNPFRIYKK